MKRVAKVRRTRIALISCSKKKSPAPGEISAWKRYLPSTLFALSYDYAKRIWGAEEVYILSAKYGVIPENAIIPDYDVSLGDLSREERRSWAAGVSKTLSAMDPNGQKTFLVLAGVSYVRNLDFGRMDGNGSKFEYPLIGLGMGKRMQRLRQMIDAADEGGADT